MIGIAGCESEALATPEVEGPPQLVVYLAYPTPLSQTHQPGAVREFLPAVAIFSDRLAVVPGSIDPDGVPRDGVVEFQALQLGPSDLDELAELLRDPELRRFAPAEDKDVAWAGAPDRVLAFVSDVGAHQTRDVALDRVPPPESFENAVELLEAIRERVVGQGEVHAPDETYALPVVPGGTLIEG